MRRAAQLVIRVLGAAVLSLGVAGFVMALLGHPLGESDFESSQVPRPLSPAPASGHPSDRLADRPQDGAITMSVVLHDGGEVACLLYVFVGFVLLLVSSRLGPPLDATPPEAPASSGPA